MRRHAIEFKAERSEVERGAVRRIHLTTFH